MPSLLVSSSVKVQHKHFALMADGSRGRQVLLEAAVVLVRDLDYEGCGSG